MSGAERARVLLLRPQARSVRPNDLPDPTPVRLLIGVISGVGGVTLLWLLGMLGYRLGYAPTVRVPGLLGDTGSGLASGTLMLIRVPAVIVEAGLASPVMLSIAFALIALPAAGLTAARPLTPGGPRPSTLAHTFGALGAVGAGLQMLAVVWWSACPQRAALMQALPADPATAGEWMDGLESAAGFDAMLMISTALWSVLALRLPVALWLRSLAACAAIFALVVAIVVMAISNTTVAQLATGHSVGIVEPGDGQRAVVLGSTHEHLAILRVEENMAVVELRDRNVTMNVLDRMSVVDFLDGSLSAP